MSVSDLLKAYQNTPQVFSLADGLTMSGPQRFLLRNLRGSSSQFVAASVFLHPACTQLNHLLICNDAEDAAYFHYTLESLTDALNICYFPSSFKNRKNYR